ncbi:hypothetical protein [Chromobacterium haemolyticum]|uniref:hypothetical protein n=1 Tax=Chromobacterium haemolyticum TaxID=394935 RepID=UPI001177A28B|nr:hypothetical protein [Chromobacterium haemolyticum]
MSSHRLLSLHFVSPTSESWGSFPNQERLREQIKNALLAHSELTEESLGFYAPPKEIREVNISAAAFDQITCMWHGHRAQGHKAPPPIPLKFFAFAFGQDAKTSWASIEIFPGIDDWGV